MPRRVRISNSARMSRAQPPLCAAGTRPRPSYPGERCASACPLSGAMSGVLSCLVPPLSHDSFPVLYAQFRHSLELAGVMGEERQSAYTGLTSDQHIGGANRRSLRREVGPDLASLPGVLVVEFQDRELKPFDAGDVLLHPLTLERPVVQLVHDDGRYTKIAGRVATDTSGDRRGRVVQRRYEAFASWR